MNNITHLPHVKALADNFSRKIISLIIHLGDDSPASTYEGFMNAFVGHTHAAAMIRQLLYWSARAKRADNRVYKSWRDWETELSFSQWRTEYLLKLGILESFGIERTVMKANGAPTNHYRLDVEAFLTKLAAFVNLTIDELLSLLMDAESSTRQRPPRRSSAQASTSKQKSPFAGQSWSDYVDNGDTLTGKPWNDDSG